MADQLIISQLLHCSAASVTVLGQTFQPRDLDVDYCARRPQDLYYKNIYYNQLFSSLVNFSFKCTVNCHNLINDSYTKNGINWSLLHIP